MNTVNNTLPHRADSPKGEITCYAIPYGAVGFVSHILTFYTAGMLASGRTPWLPFRKNTRYKLDMILSILGIIITLVVAIFTIVRCHSRWEFVLLAVWKMMLSLTFGGLATHAAVIVQSRSVAGAKGRWEMQPVYRVQVTPSGYIMQGTPSGGRNPDRRIKIGEKKVWVEPPGPMLHLNDDASLERFYIWFSAYTIGSFVGLVGLGSLIHRSWSNIQIRSLTYGFVSFVGVVSLMVPCVLFVWTQHGANSFAWECQACGKALKAGLIARPRGAPLQRPACFVGSCTRNPTWLIIIAFVCCLASVFYGDWILAALAGNRAGTPDGNNAVLYWAYFAAKRLPLLSF